jgi:cyanate lyase
MLNTEIAATGGKVVDTIGAQSLGLRDAIERNALGLATGATNAAGVAAATARDIQVAIERNGLTGTGVTERVGSGLMSSVERTAGETRLANAVADAATRQATNDLARDITSSGVRGTTDVLKSLADDRYLGAVADAASRQAINDLARDITSSGVKGTTDIMKAIADDRYTTAISQAATQQASNDLTRDVIANVNRSTNEIMKGLTDSAFGALTAVERNGNSNRELTTQVGYETRTLMNDRANTAILESHRGFDRLHGQSSAQYASLLLEQHKSSDQISRELAEAKYEALKNKEHLSMQLAASSAEGKYEALKNTQMLSAQLAECCCEIKMKVSDVGTKVDDTVKTLDSNRVRDSLSVANNEINMYRMYERFDDYGRGRRRSRSPDRRRGGD